MKFTLTLLAGVVTGAALAVFFILLNPLTSADSLSPLAVSENQLMILRYSAVPGDALLHTNDGESRVKPVPSDVQQLWEPTIEHTSISVVELNDVRGNPAGIGIKYSSLSESTRLFSGEANVDSVWHVFLPERGSLFVGQRENYFDYLREIVIPAQWAASKNWKGQWRQNLTSGPGVLGTGSVTGGSGAFRGLQSDAVEAYAARAYSAKTGPVAVDGELAIELPRQRAAELAPESR